MPTRISASRPLIALAYFEKAPRSKARSTPMKAAKPSQSQMVAFKAPLLCSVLLVHTESEAQGAVQP